jgi:ubiquinone biosynthesis protein COQ9
MLQFLRKTSSIIGIFCKNSLQKGNLQLTKRLSTNVDDYHNSSDSSSSESDFDDTMKEDDTKQKILLASMEFVPKYGWSRKTLAAGAAKSGFPSTAHGLFPRGGAELVHFLTRTCNEKLVKEMLEVKDKTTERENRTQIIIRKSLEVRLRMLIPYIDNWHQAMALMALPQNAPEALQNLFTMVDDIWFSCDDRTTDFSWYTKRASLAVLYKTSELFMTQDRSTDYLQTWQFLDRRIDNLALLGRTCQQSTDYLWSAFQVVSIICKSS